MDLSSGETITIKTHNNDSLYYTESQLCEWNINAGVGQRMQVKVVTSDLQYAPPGSLCDGFDNVKIIDDNSKIHSIIQFKIFFCYMTLGLHI